MKIIFCSLQKRRSVKLALPPPKSIIYWRIFHRCNRTFLLAIGSETLNLYCDSPFFIMNSLVSFMKLFARCDVYVWLKCHLLSPWIMEQSECFYCKLIQPLHYSIYRPSAECNCHMQMLCKWSYLIFWQFHKMRQIAWKYVGDPPPTQSRWKPIKRERDQAFHGEISSIAQFDNSIYPAYRILSSRTRPASRMNFFQWCPEIYRRQQKL